MQTLLNTVRLNSENAKEYVYRVLKDNIMRFVLKPGSQFNEADIASQLSVSRTPVREALTKLRDDLLVEVYPQQYTAVSYLDWALICEGVEIRRVIEAKVLSDACGNIPSDFQSQLRSNLAMQAYSLNEAQDIELFQTLDLEMHSLIYRAIGRDWSWEVVLRASQHFNRFLYLRNNETAELKIPHLKLILDAHKVLLDALFSGTPIDFSVFTTQHIFNFASLPNDLDIYNLNNYTFKDYFKQPDQNTLRRLQQLRAN